MKHQLTVTSDGTPRGTYVTDAEGKKLENVSAVTVWMEPEEFAKVEVTVRIPRVDLHAEVETVYMVCPVCGDQVSHGCNEGEPRTPITLSGEAAL